MPKHRHRSGDCEDLTYAIHDSDLIRFVIRDCGARGVTAGLSKARGA